MWRRLAVVLFLLGLLRVLWAERAVEAQYPWSKTKTPTRTPTRPPVPTATPIPATPPPVPPSPTPQASGSDLTVTLGNCVTGAASRRLGPAARVDVISGGVTRRIRPGRPGGCWLLDDGTVVSLGDAPFLVRWTAQDGSVEEMDGRDGTPVILTASSNGPTDQLAVSRPAPVVLATRRR